MPEANMSKNSKIMCSKFYMNGMDLKAFFEAVNSREEDGEKREIAEGLLTKAVEKEDDAGKVMLFSEETIRELVRCASVFHMNHIAGHDIVWERE